ncbi:MAG: VPLPA-CTERM sorting domain-containing protein [Planctomycetaceae bacterium]|nr:VPLPA-CTERM sorting domain-containing protein [Planctomycetaceae bacterium]
MHLRILRVYLLAFSTVLWSPLARATDLNEFMIAGADFSSVGSQPTPFALTLGDNSLIGRTSSVDFDFLRVTVPANHTLDAIVVTFHEDINQVYAGLQAGQAWTAGSGEEIDPSQLLGWANFPSNPHHGAHTGEDILDDIGLGAGSTGFAPPLPSGVYTFLFQTASSEISYGLNFSVSPAGGSLPGDFNGDLTVNNVDLGVWKGAFGATDAGDANDDGLSNGTDMLVWQRNAGLTAASAAAHAVPEPAGALLALGSLAGYAAWRRRRA